MRMLIVDDEVAIAAALKELLELDGHEAALAQNGREASVLLEQQTFDLVITDYIMPEMNGGDLIAHIRQHAGLGDLPIILVSAGHVKHNELPIDGFLRKPFSFDDLMEKIEQATGGNEGKT